MAGMTDPRLLDRWFRMAFGRRTGGPGSLLRANDLSRLARESGIALDELVAYATKKGWIE
jgi:hypothetical protein